MTATVRDVARAARVSLGTVSRVINGDPRVDGVLAKRVESAIGSLNYRRLRRRRRSGAGAPPLAGRTIALVLLGYHRSLIELPVVAAALHGVEAAVARGGGSLSLIDLPDPRALTATLRDTGYDAVVCKAALQGDPLGRSPRTLLARLRAQPLVWLLGRPRGAWGDSVDPDDVAVGTLACEHLLARGHRRLAYLSPKPDHVSLERRCMAFAWRSQREGVAAQAFVGTDQRWELPLRPPTEVAQVDALVDRLLAARPRPTAVFCPADSIAALVYRALATRRLEVGRDLSVVSANNEVALQVGLHPGLDTLDVHAEDAGRRAVDHLAWRLAHPGEAAAMSIQIAPELLVRGSVAQL